MITRTKYNVLKKHERALTESEIVEMKEFEDSQRKILKGKNKDYFERLHSNVDESTFVVKYDILMHKFLEKFREIEGAYFNDGKKGENLTNLNTILYYFSKDQRFFECKNLSTLSEPSFEKGLLIVGNYGNGKTSTLRTLKELFNHTPLSFKMYTSNKIVSTFESYKSPSERHSYMNRTKSGRAYFDDVKTEKIASNYGFHNLMKDIIEERYISKLPTYITCNYKDGDNSQDLIMALQEFQEKYGPRVYDRIFQMFNVIEFNGKSLRK